MRKIRTVDVTDHRSKTEHFQNRMDKVLFFWREVRRPDGKMGIKEMRPGTRTKKVRDLRVQDLDT